MTDLVDRWIRYHRDKCKPSDPLFAAWEEVDELVRSDGDVGWKLVLQLINAAPDDGVLAAVAAGPLEDLLARMRDEQFDRVEVEARRSPKFRRCLTGVWGLAPRIRERLAKYVSIVKDPL